MENKYAFDEEWVKLIWEAKMQGLKKEDVLAYIKQKDQYWQKKHITVRSNGLRFEVKHRKKQ
ncbi:DNA-binding anti-repressor SinI [Lentibacillus sediminis]|uniref:DNA-binding anti-repressor SinI n=1 Tax=Lentibacillus sediminis TaxID=1940529 RepID=UPI000C1C07DA|nr:DNA-binding anti-repressor SinI [Lentibacillus sediminis]